MTNNDRQLRAEELAEGLTKYPVPPGMHRAITDWVLDHHLPGHFLTAVLENNLCEAVGRADEENILALQNWVRLLYNYTPGCCWGSVRKVRTWLEEERSA